MMNNDETNGALLILEQLIKSIDHQIQMIDREGDLSDKSFEFIRQAKLQLINLANTVNSARGWNSMDL